MIRRRRRVREVPFSFDSFLDVVANVVGIIIRLILVVWVGARSYSSINFQALQGAANNQEPVAGADQSLDPLEMELARFRQELAISQASLLEQLRHLGEVKKDQKGMEARLADLSRRRSVVDQSMAEIDAAAGTVGRQAQVAALSLEELRTRQEKLEQEIRELESRPPQRHALRYRTPVSRPVESDEFFFECRRGRVSWINVAALLAQVRGELQEKQDLLRTRWELTDVTAPIGPYRLRYTFERERGLVDAVVPGSGPDANAPYRCGLSEWTVEPLTEMRGESVEAALREGSEFRQVADRLDPQQATVTFWVYPDSFGAYRRLRDYLYERDLVVAGRPLPEGVGIASSRRGSLSLGQ